MRPGSRDLRLSLSVALLAVSSGCTETSGRAASQPPPHLAAPARSKAPAPQARAAQTLANDPLRARPVLLVTDPRALAAAELAGLSIAEQLTATLKGLCDNRVLSETPEVAPLVRTLTADVRGVKVADPLAGLSIARFSHRLFDVRWLSSANTRLELVGLTARFDRQPFHAGGCGEKRLIYRMRHASDAGLFVSRLPMTLAIEYRIRGPDCASEAARFFESEGRVGQELGEWLSSERGPFNPRGLEPSREAQLVVVNLQQVRWPSTIRPDLGGHAEYLLRAFRRGALGYEPASLENTPDLERLGNQPAFRSELLAFLRSPAQLKRIDSGTLLLPERFLSKRAISVTPRGLARHANRPFTTLYSQKDFEGTDFSSGRRVRSSLGLLRRLDGLSCPGCHESRSVAGFHLLGEEPPGAPVENALAEPISPHLAVELPRREQELVEFLQGKASDFATPFPERGSEFGGFGAPCGLGSDPSFSEWRCDAGFRCVRLDEAEVGECVSEQENQVGAPCEFGELRPHANSLRDRMTRTRSRECGATSVCNTSAVGFPSGMCTEACDRLSGDARCGRIAVLDPFNACLARKTPFLECLRTQVTPAGLRRCSRDAPCRDDYVCAGEKHAGVCIPPYFVFQLRVDGH